jgi:hypothetical protein
MCIFSQAVQHVSQTSIYARGAGKEQILVYSMSLAASAELAMILPLPVEPGSGEDAVRFIDLSPYPKFFSDLRNAFPMELSASFAIPSAAPAFAPQALKVHDVGSFEASFVPTIADFERLDARFRLDPTLWKYLPSYADFGFAVFKLRPKTVSENIHPMAFAFPRRDVHSLFFPTLHVHDGAVHETAAFDHDLFCQTPSSLGPGWTPSHSALANFVDALRVPDLVDWSTGGHHLSLHADLPNRDIVFAAEDSVPPVIER